MGSEGEETANRSAKSGGVPVFTTNYTHPRWLEVIDNILPCL